MNPKANGKESFVVFQDNIPAKNLQEFLSLVRKHHGEFLSDGKRDYRGFFYSVRFLSSEYCEFCDNWRIVTKEKTLIEKIKDWLNN